MKSVQVPNKHPLNSKYSDKFRFYGSPESVTTWCKDTITYIRNQTAIRAALQLSSAIQLGTPRRCPIYNTNTFWGFIPTLLHLFLEFNHVPGILCSWPEYAFVFQFDTICWS